MICPSDMRAYALTIRALGKDNTIKAYDPVIEHIKKYVNIQCYIYESNNERDGYHYHGMITASKNLFRKKLMYQGFNVDLKELKEPKDIRIWVWYIYKTIKANDEEECIRNDIIYTDDTFTLTKKLF